jgi:hypothetical protein
MAVVVKYVKRTSGMFSGTIPASTHAEGMVVSCPAKAAYPNETGCWHPVFGTRRPDGKFAYWAKMPHRPFIEEAADACINEAADVILDALIAIAGQLGL